jgi:hypothetical protein
MKKTVIILFIVLFAHEIVKGQGNDSICQIDTLEIVLAYEFKGQCNLGDMIFKCPEFIEYKDENISGKNYKSGVYQFITPLWTDINKLKRCGLEITVDSIVNSKNPFQGLETKVIFQRNKSFKREETSMVGNEPKEQNYHDFKYKLFKVKFVRMYIGNETRTIVNIDRKSKFEKETISMDCPIYIMTEILNIEIIE